MHTGIKVIQQPTDLPVSVAMLKEHLRLDGSDQDTMLSLNIQAATQAVEKELFRAVPSQQMRQTLDRFTQAIELWYPPCISIQKIEYIANGQRHLLEPAQYQLDNDSEPAQLYPAHGRHWPATDHTPNAVRIEFTAGYPATQVPPAIQQAIIALAADLYEHPEASVETRLSLNKTIKWLITSMRVPTIGA